MHDDEEILRQYVEQKKAVAAAEEAYREAAAALARAKERLAALRASILSVPVVAREGTKQGAILAAIANGPMRAPEVAKLIYGDDSFKSKRSATAQLDILKRKGLAVSNRGSWSAVNGVEK